MARKADAHRPSARVTSGLQSGAFLRTVAYHATPPQSAAALDAQFAWLARHFDAVTPAHLDTAFAGRYPRNARPRVMLAFFNGFADNFSVARPLLERHGLVGWFFVATEWLGVDANDQRAHAVSHGMRAPASASVGPPERLALTWDEVRALDQNHVIASHTRSHTPVHLGDADRLRAEIVGSHDDLREQLGHDVAAFAWLLGSPYGEHPVADALVREAGYRYLFSNLGLQRI